MFAARVDTILKRFVERAKDKWWLWLLLLLLAEIFRDRVGSSANRVIDEVGLASVLGGLFSPLVLPALVLALAFGVVLYLAYRDTRTAPGGVRVEGYGHVGPIESVRTSGAMSWIEPWAYRLGAARLLRKLYIATREQELATLDTEAITRVQAPKDWADSVYREIGLPREPSYDPEHVLARKEEHERENAAQAARQGATPRELEEARPARYESLHLSQSVNVTVDLGSGRVVSQSSNTLIRGPEGEGILLPPGSITVTPEPVRLRLTTLPPTILVGPPPQVENPESRPSVAVSTCQSQDGKVIRDGESTTLILQHGASERIVTGTIRAFEQDGHTRWEVVTGDPQHPAIGFLPEHVVTRIDGPDTKRPAAPRS